VVKTEQSSVKITNNRLQTKILDVLQNKLANSLAINTHEHKTIEWEDANNKLTIQYPIL